MINNKLKAIENPKKIMDLAKISDKSAIVEVSSSKNERLAKIARLYLVNKKNSMKITKKVNLAEHPSMKKVIPKIVGDIKHYPPANKEWKNSVYAYNKDSLRSLAALDKIASRTIKSYFNLTNNRKLARSYRMRNLIRRTTSKRVYTSKPEIKQTGNKVNITVYILNREGQFLLRKLYFYKKNMNINRDIYLHKIWLKKNLLAFNKTFKNKKSIRLLAKNKKLTTKRKKRNKTYIHNFLVKNYLSNLTKNTEKSGFVSASDIINNSNKNTKYISHYIKENIYKTLKKRGLIRSLKRRERLSHSMSINNNVNEVKANQMNIESESSSHQSLVTFENYLLAKKTRKLKFKLRNSSSTIKIKKRLSRFFIFKGRRRKRRYNKIRLPYSNLRFKKEIRFFSFKLVSELKYIRKLFLYRFIKYIFSLLNIKIYISKKIADLGNKQTELKQSNNSFTIGKQFLKYEFIKTKENKKINNKSKNSKKKQKAKIIKISFKKRYSYDKLKKIELLNLELLNFLKFIISGKKKSQFSKELNLLKLGEVVKNNNKVQNINFNKNNFDILYKKFEKKYFLRFLAKFFKKEFLYINYFSRFLINKFKFGKFLPGLKHLINKIYSKKVKLNIVNLKYPQLNSDIYADTIASKLKKKLSLLRVLRSSLSLAKLPISYLSYDRMASYNKLSSLIIHKSLNVEQLSENHDLNANSVIVKQGLDKDPLNLVLNKLYPYSYVTFAKNNSLEESYTNTFNSPEKSALLAKTTSIQQAKNLKILNMIRYKWVSGVRLEAAGRLTRRYTAARSVFKFRYKGSLKNIDYSQKADISKRNASTVMLRNYVKANSQYSFSKSKRRIGAFGLKAKIASY